MSIKDAFDKVGVTPEGIYCLDCGKCFALSTWKRHFQNDHPLLTFTKQFKFAQRIKSKIALARADEDRRVHAIVPHSIVRKTYCFGCAKAFEHQPNYYKHLKDYKGEVTPCASTPNQTLLCYQLLDGRFYPVEVPSYSMASTTSTATTPTTTDVNTARLLATAPIPRSANVLPILPYNPLVSTLEFFTACDHAPINNTLDTGPTERVLSKFVKLGDPIDGWVKIFHKRVSSEPNFEAIMRHDLKKMDFTLLYEENAGFRMMMDSFDRLEDCACGIIQGIPGNWSAQTTRFADPDGESDSIWLFRQRNESDIQRNEFGRLVAYLRGHLSCNIVHHYLHVMSDPDMTVEKAQYKGWVAKMMYELAIMKDDNGDSSPWLCKYLQARCFTIVAGELRFMDHGRVSSQMATMTYIIRLSLTLLLNMFNHCGNPTQEDVDIAINRVQKGPTINTISKWVSICRQMKKLVAPKNTSTIKADGTIVCNDAVYPKQIWSRLIPIVTARILEIILTMFDGTECQKFINAFHNQPELIKIANWFDGNVQTTSGDGETISLNDLRVDGAYHLRSLDFQQLVSLTEIVFHGLSGGSERGTTIDGLLGCGLRLDPAMHLYFYAIHDKQSKTQNSTGRKQVRHRIPQSAVILVILFRKICLLLGHTGSTLFPRIDNRSHYMKDSIGDIFNFGSNSTSKIDIRKLYTSICNCVFADPTKGTQLIADDEACVMNNHSAGSHLTSYATTLANSEEIMFEKYHEALGEVTIKNFYGRIEVRPHFGDDDILSALQDLVGVHADYRDFEQKQMLRLVCNSYDKHKFFGIACGGGKSLSILVPIVVRLQASLAVGCQIVIEPYSFLRESLKTNYLKRLGHLQAHVQVESYSAADITDGAFDSLPSSLRSDNPPHILLLTLDAASNLVSHHKERLAYWSSKNKISGIFFDEIQTAISEFNFRPAYEKLREFATLGVPITCLSGSFPSSLVVPVMRYLRLLPSNNDSDDVALSTIDFVESQDLVGDGFTFWITKVNNFVKSSIAFALRSLQRGAVHLICANKFDSIAINNQLQQQRQNSAVVNSDSTIQDVCRIADLWSTGQIDILVSTTVALVGCENKLCRSIGIVRPIYNIANLVQGFGRLRLEQRGDDAVVHLFFPKNFEEDMTRLASTCDSTISQLITANVIRSDDYTTMKACFHTDGYSTLYKPATCLLVTVATLLSPKLVGKENCNRCSACFVMRKKQLQQMREKNHSEATIATKRPNPYINNRVNKKANTMVENQTNAAIRQTMEEGKEKKTADNLCRINPYINNRVSEKANTMVENQTNTAIHQTMEGIKEKKTSENLCQWLTANCGHCNKPGRECDGDKCVKGCFSCGGRHRSSNCAYHQKQEGGKSVKEFLVQRRVCIFCYGWMNGELHGVEKGATISELRCPMKKRLRALVYLRGRDANGTFLEFIKATYASEEIFNKFLCSLKVNTKDRRSL